MILHPLLQRFHWLTRFLLSPRQIGSITPSSRFLVHALLQPVDWRKVNRIVELGAGTGVVTKEIERRRREACLSIVFEMDPSLRQMLEESYPQAHICADAAKLQAEMEQIGVKQVDCIVSSLPFFNFTKEERFHLLSEIRQSLSPDGLFVAYQYSLQLKPLLKPIFREVDIRFVPFNIPPAFVYICR